MTRTEILRLAAGLVWVVAIALLAAERRIVRRLQRASSSTPDSAIPLAVASPLARFRLARLVRSGAVVRTGPERFYLDPDGFAGYRRSRRRRALIVLLGVLLPAAGVLWWISPP
jgi:hypothetical protein